MPHPEIHEEIDKLVFGKSYPHVHKWMDGAFDGTNGRTHWVWRHHLKAINEHFTPALRAVARLHVVTDWMFYHKIILLPKDSEEVAFYLKKFGTWIK